MDITKDFIILYMPKTGTTFTYKAIRKVYANMKYDLGYRLKKDRKSLFFKGITNYNAYTAKLKLRLKEHHGTFRQIPAKYLDGHREIVTIVRSPFDGYTSRYKFGMFKTLPDNFKDLQEAVNHNLPNFPEISFEEYVTVFSREFLKIEYAALGIDFNESVGIMTYQFINFFAKDPKKLLILLTKNKASEIDVKAHFPEIKFLFNERLNTMLYEYLSQLGYEEKHIQFIPQAKRENVSKEKNNNQQMINSELERYILEKEALLFRLFPQYIPIA